jgi:hypothetical protein
MEKDFANFSSRIQNIGIEDQDEIKDSDPDLVKQRVSEPVSAQYTRMRPLKTSDAGKDL